MLLRQGLTHILPIDTPVVQEAMAAGPNYLSGIKRRDLFLPMFLTRLVMLFWFHIALSLIIDKEAALWFTSFVTLSFSVQHEWKCDWLLLSKTKEPHRAIDLFIMSMPHPASPLVSTLSHVQYFVGGKDILCKLFSFKYLRSVRKMSESIAKSSKIHQ